MEKKRLVWLDIAKGLAILLVILGHSLDYLSPVRKVIFSFHMPLFFIAAGYTFREKPRAEQLKVSAKRLLIPYVLLFVATSIVDVTVSNAGNELNAIVGKLPAFIWAGGWIWHGIQHVGAIWFFVALFGARVLFNELLRIFREKEVAVPLQGVVMCTLACAGYLVGSVTDIWLPFDIDIYPVAALFLWVGWLLREQDCLDAVCKPIPLVVTAVIWIIAVRFSSLEVATRVYTLFPVAIIGSIAGSLLAFAFSRMLERLSENSVASKPIASLSYIGQKSMRLFCIHHLDYYINWGAIGISLFGLHNITVGLIRIIFDVLLLVLFELFA